ncbi:MAG: DUF2497 domain-containing protein [Hyphomicrobiaceae bacterium]
MSKKSNGNDRDIETILADIRVQAQRRQRLAHTINPGLAQQHANGGTTGQHAAASGLAYAYQKHGTEVSPRQPDLPVILLKNGITPKVGQPAGAQTPSGSVATNVKPLSSALQNLRSNLEQINSTGKQDKEKEPKRTQTDTPDVSQKTVVVESVPRSNGPDGSASNGLDGLSALKPNVASKPENENVALPTSPPATSAPAVVEVVQKPQVVAAQPGLSSASENMASKPRTMVPFKDTRMSRMVGPTTFEKKTDANVVSQPPLAGDSAMKSTVTDPVISQSTNVATKPPISADATQVGRGEVDDVHDVAAELLRPMLKDWVGENMPQIVQKALELENGGGDKKDEDT